MQKTFIQYTLLSLVSFAFNLNVLAQTRQKILFNDDWKFYKGDLPEASKSNFNDNDWRKQNLPHDWSIEGPFDQKWASATAYLPAGIGWYRKTFQLNPNLRNKNVYIYFDGVYNNSEVWVNGHYLGKRPNGFIPFQYEITKYLNYAGKNSIAVKANHSEFADSRWYTGSGIYRNVYLVATNPVSIGLWGVGFSTPQVSAQKASAKVAVTVNNKSALTNAVVVKARLLDKQGKAIAEAQQPIAQIKTGAAGNANLNFTVNNPALWSVANPNLYNLEVSLYVQGKKVDELVQPVGIRSIRFDADKGFFLNGENLKLKGLCIHDDAGALGVAVPEEVWARRLQNLKDAGCNAIRLSHNPHADYLYNLFDQMGFLVMDEAFDEWEAGKNKWITGWNNRKPGQDGYHQYFKEWANRDLGDMVRCNRNHPSIIMWSIGNEIDYPNDPYSHPILNTGRNPQIYGRGYAADHPAATRLTELAKQLVAVVKQVDTTRPVTAALAGVVMSNEVGYPEVLDVVGYNYQEYRYPDDHQKYPNRFIYGSENGMAPSAWQAVADNPYIAGQFLWTGIDYMGEARQWPARASQAGLLDLAGFKKPLYYFRQSLWSDKPMVYIGTSLIAKDTSKRSNNRFVLNADPTWNYNPGDSVTISCFTNCTSAELFLNGKSLGKKILADAREKVISWKTTYQPGELLVKGFKGGEEVSNSVLKTAGKAVALVAKADLKGFVPNKRQLTHIEIAIIDQNGNPVYNAGDEITLDIAGPAKLLGLESGSITSHEDYKTNKRTALHGKLLAYVQSQWRTGAVNITISANGLKPTEITLPVQ